MMISAEDVIALDPCWSRDKIRALLPEPIPILDALRLPGVSPEDVLWVALRPQFISDRVLRLFGIRAAERALHRERQAGREPDSRSWATIEAARRYALNEITAVELARAADAAWAAVGAAAWTAVGAAAKAAERAAAWTAAWTARTAAWTAAADAARVAAKDAERAQQLQDLIELLELEDPAIAI